MRSLSIPSANIPVRLLVGKAGKPKFYLSPKPKQDTLAPQAIEYKGNLYLSSN